eukprot:365183-Chlamydomonas_euryale.AAC.7
MGARCHRRVLGGGSIPDAVSGPLCGLPSNQARWQTGTVPSLRSSFDWQPRLLRSSTLPTLQHSLPVRRGKPRPLAQDPTTVPPPSPLHRARERCGGVGARARRSRKAAWRPQRRARRRAGRHSGSARRPEQVGHAAARAQELDPLCGMHAWRDPCLERGGSGNEGDDPPLVTLVVARGFARRACPCVVRAAEGPRSPRAG